ncbi:acetyl-CoA acetyltransferase [Patulibacter defluvii]|uniref:acetyl-CoA acetyltransferase n=1 Tax=Patulibacter defluvii TaxID=3095358 RepID=UPI002A75DDDA|nr:acetyl-CoA acetyltransferase [Patulibacter sp. DM4]
MSTVDPRTPVLVGTGQVTHRPGADPTSPLDLMVEAARRAAADAGPGGDALLAGVESVAVVDVFSWPIPDPGTLVATELGLSPRETVRSVIGGNGPIALLGDLASRIADGQLDRALLVGGEVVSVFRSAMASGGQTGWPTQPDGTAPTRVVGHDAPPSHPAELAAGLVVPANYYPVFEHALRHEAGRTTAEQQAWIGSWWSRYSEVAAGHPNAWSTTPMSAEQVASPEAGNRPISDPYLKCMVANITVDQSAALLLTSAGAAEAAGIPRDRWVFVHATAGAADHWLVGERDQLHRSPAIAANGAAVFGHAGIDADDVALVDLYSCFPCAVQIGARELGFAVDDPARPLTVTGGLVFFGGPANNYVTHSLATLVDRAREQPDALALASAVGWYMTKHGLALLSARPPARPYAHHDVQATVDAGPRRSIVEDPSGRWTVESFTASYDREGQPNFGTVVARDGERRAFAKTGDAATIATLLGDDPIGRPVELGGEPGFAL